MTMIAHIEKRRPEFDGFSSYYRKTLHPELERLERKRRKARPRTLLICLAIGILGLAISLFIFMSGEQVSSLIFGIIFTAMAVFGGFVMSSSRLYRDLKQTVMRGVTDYLGWTLTLRADRAELEPFRDLGLIPSNTLPSSEDCVSGDAFGLEFVNCDISARSGGKGSRTYFEGQVTRMDCPLGLSEPIVLETSRAEGHAPRRESLRSLSSEHVVVPEDLKAYGRHQDDLDQLMTPGLSSMLLKILHYARGKDLRIAFADDRMLVAIEGADRFEFGAFKDSLLEGRSVQATVREYEFLLDTIEAVSARVSVQDS